jgi:hypothetical protein
MLQGGGGRGAALGCPAVRWRKTLALMRKQRCENDSKGLKGKKEKGSRVDSSSSLYEFQCTGTQVVQCTFCGGGVFLVLLHEGA